MFYTIIIKNDSQSIYSYETSEAAVSAFHSEMAYAYNAKIVTTCMVIDAFGNQIKRERYEVPAEIEPNDG